MINIKQSCTLLIIGLALITEGCAKLTSIDDTKELSHNSGVLLVHVTSELHEVLQMHIIKPQQKYPENYPENFLSGYFFTPAYMFVLIYESKKYWVLSLPKGEYMWGYMRTVNWPFSEYYAKLYRDTKFSIKPNCITYIGDITLTTEEKEYSDGNKIVNIDVKNNIKQAHEYMHLNYPMLSRTCTFEQKITKFKIQM